MMAVGFRVRCTRTARKEENAMKKLSLKVALTGLVLAAFGMVGCQMEDKEAAAPEAMEPTMETTEKAATEAQTGKKAAETTAGEAAEKASQAKPKDHPAH
jgi:hypothetical protein